ncbi:hypothetical protein D6D01_03184 [Aureobasidium pullulans]|uniref:Concanavalin A-like lectin/glucanase n=1 Tax=Aureobasidium pullulans TaxID=5580 RepID=A0A4S9LLM8_AURPU|nr:hypothetical protein D6D01_03184 [Aureobasidium pullulans]
MRSTPIISLGYALAGLSVVQATSFVTVTKTVIKDTLVGSVNSAPLTPTLDRRSFVEPPDVEMDKVDPNNEWWPFPNRREYFHNPCAPSDYYGDGEVTGVGMTVTTKGEEFAFTTTLTLEPHPFSLEEVIWHLTVGKHKPESEQYGTGPRGRVMITRPTSTSQTTTSSKTDDEWTTKVLTLKTKDEAFVFTTRLAFDGLEGPGHYPTPEECYRLLTPTGYEVEQEDTPPNAMSTEASDPKFGEHSSLDSAKDTRAIAARSPSDDPDDNPDDDAPHWPKTIALPTRSAMYDGPTRDVRATVPIAPPRPKITIPLTAIPTDWPHPIGPDQDPADPGRPVKIPVIYNTDYEDPESSTFTVAWTAHHYCQVFPHPMSLCTNESWIKEHQLHTRPPAKAPLVQRAEATPIAVDAGVMTGSVVVSSSTVTAASTATANRS